jgi:anti-anti-sigma regulatory factor
MAKKTKTSRIGFDPLAWMKDDAAEQSSAKADATPKKAAEAATKQCAHQAAPRSVLENGNASSETKTARVGDATAAPSAGSDPKAIALGESLTIKDVKRLQDELRGALANRKRIVLEAASVENVDAAGLQLLDALMHEARTRQVDVQWRDPSVVVARGAGTLGLTDKLRLPS